MGMNGQPPEMADVTGLPTYVIDTVVRRDIGGFASIINCRTYGNLRVPQCELVISLCNLVTLSQAAQDFALEMHRRVSMAQMMEGVGVRH
jgi:hypothetical protein